MAVKRRTFTATSSGRSVGRAVTRADLVALLVDMAKRKEPASVLRVRLASSPQAVRDEVQPALTALGYGGLFA